jgi:hypothetical protein
MSGDKEPIASMESIRPRPDDPQSEAPENCPAFFGPVTHSFLPDIFLSSSSLYDDADSLRTAGTVSALRQSIAIMEADSQSQSQPAIPLRLLIRSLRLYSNWSSSFLIRIEQFSSSY